MAEDKILASRIGRVSRKLARMEIEDKRLQEVALLVARTTAAEIVELQEAVMLIAEKVGVELPPWSEDSEPSE